MPELRRAIAIDFDGCISAGLWPDVGPPNDTIIKAAMREKERGAALILWTCRTGEDLQKAVDYCREIGLEIDAVNENLPERVELYGGDPRKVDADEYWDDRAVCMSRDTIPHGRLWYTQRGAIVKDFMKWADKIDVAVCLYNLIAYLDVENAVTWNGNFIRKIMEQGKDEE